MKTLILRENTSGRTTKLDAKTTYETDFGEWVAEVDGKELLHACSILCEGIEGCRCEDLHVEADLDDDGKEYKVSTS